MQLQYKVIIYIEIKVMLYIESNQSNTLYWKDNPEQTFFNTNNSDMFLKYLK